MPRNIIKTHGTKFNLNLNLSGNPSNNTILLLPGNRKSVRFSNRLNKTFNPRQIIKGNNDFLVILNQKYEMVSLFSGIFLPEHF